MIQSGRSGARLALVVLCVFAAFLTTAQEAKLSPAERAKQEARKAAAAGIAAGQTETIAPAPRTMPNVLWLERSEAMVLLRRQLHRVAKIAGSEGIVIAQDPQPDAQVSPDGNVAITLGVPKLSLKASSDNPRTDEQVTFSLAFDPPAPSSSKIEYHFVWDDGGQVTTAEPQTTRQFPEARTHTVTAYAVINGQWTAGRTTTQVTSRAPDLAPDPVTMPTLLWLEINDANALLAPLQLNAEVAGQDGIVIGQNPLPGANVAPESVVTLTTGIPKLTLSAPALNPNVNDEVTFNLSFDPAPPAPPGVTYRIQWPDGTGETSTDQAVVVHRFPSAGSYNLVATALIHGNWRVESNQVMVSVTGQPPPVDSSPVDVPVALPQPPSTIPWLLIVLVAAALIGGALLLRARRARNKVPPQPPPAVSIRNGLGSTSHTIEHPEQISNGLSIRLRGGIRSVTVMEGEADA